MRFHLMLYILVVVWNAVQGKVRRSADYLIGSMNYGGTVTFGEQGVFDCLAAGNPPAKCITEQSGIEPQTW